jgi:hypothetical protein
MELDASGAWWPAANLHFCRIVASLLRIPIVLVV